MKKKRLSKDILILVILSLITVLTWIGLDLHRIFSKQETPDVPSQQMELLNPEIDQEIINQISEESLFEKGEYLSPEIPISEEATSEAEGGE